MRSKPIEPRAMLIENGHDRVTIRFREQCKSIAISRDKRLSISVG